MIPVDIEKVAYRLRQVIDWLEMDKGAFCDYLDISSSRLSGWTDGEHYPIRLEYALQLKEDHNISLDWIYAGDGSGQGSTLTRELEAVVPAPLILKPRKKKAATAKRKRAA